MNEQGFSMIELLIVVVILGIISAIAVPNLLQARRASNEASAVSSVSLIYRSQHTFRLSNEGEYADLPTLRSENLIDSTLGDNAHIKSGYRFEVDVYPATATEDARFDLRGRPVIHSLDNAITGTGGFDFGMNEAGGIYMTTDNTPVNFDGSTRLPTGTATVYSK